MFRPTLLRFLALVGLAAASTPDVSSAPDDGDKRVKIELYYESQCPGCRAMITQSFKEAFDAPDFLKMADVTLVPYGNAREVPPSPPGPPGTKPGPPPGPHKFECQHGPSECVFNAMEACALAKIKCPYMQFKFVYCIENNDDDRTPEQDYDGVLKKCVKETGIEEDVADAIHACYKGPEGNQLEFEMAKKTDALTPKHTYVPWVVADGKHDDKVQNKITKSLLAYVCDTYDGPDKSSGCPSQKSLRLGPGLTEDDFCYPDAQTVELQ